MTDRIEEDEILLVEERERVVIWRSEGSTITNEEVCNTLGMVNLKLYVVTANTTNDPGVTVGTTPKVDAEAVIDSPEVSWSTRLLLLLLRNVWIVKVEVGR